MKYRARYRGPYSREASTFLTLDLYGSDYPDATVDGIYTTRVRSARGFAAMLDRAEAVLGRLKEIDRKHAEFEAWLAGHKGNADFTDKKFLQKRKTTWRQSTILHTAATSAARYSRSASG